MVVLSLRNSPKWLVFFFFFFFQLFKPVRYTSPRNRGIFATRAVTCQRGIKIKNCQQHRMPPTRPAAAFEPLLMHASERNNKTAKARRREYRAI